MASWLSNAARPPSPAKLSETRLCAILFILMYAIASRRQPTRATRGRVTFLEDFAQQGFSSRKSRFRGLAAPQPGDVRGFPRPGQVAFAAAELLFPKSFNWGSKIHSGVEGGRHGVELVFSRTYFLQNEFYSSPLKLSVVHDDVDSEISL